MKRLTVIAGILVLFASCYNDKADKLYPPPTSSSNDPCDTTNKTLSYASDIHPILMSNCAQSGCHDAATPSSTYDFTTYASVESAIANHKFVESITHTGNATPMPQGLPMLPTCTIAQIVKWVNQGHPNN